MQPLRWNYRPDGLRAPALVCAFKGWNDAGEAASYAAGYLARQRAANRLEWDDAAALPKAKIEQVQPAAPNNRPAR